MANWIQWIVTTILKGTEFFTGKNRGLHDMKQKKDQELLNRIKQTLPSSGSTISYLLTKHDFSVEFKDDLLAPIDSLDRLFNQPDNYFLDKELEKKREKLANALKDFRQVIAEKIFRSNTMPGYYTIVTIDEIARGILSYSQRQGKSPNSDEVRAAFGEAHRQFEINGRELNSAATKLLTAYSELLKSAHRRILVKE